MLNRPDAATVPIIAMTANTFSSDVDVCRVAGMNEHVAKPIDFVKLNGVVRKFLL
jgi:CheY-like chemotaxis protein